METIQLPTLPAAVESKLRTVRARQVVISLVAAASWSGSVLLACALISMLADRWLFFSATGTRVLMTSGALGLAGFTFVVSLGTQLRSVLRLERTAALIDKRVPALEERWSTVARMASAVASPSAYGYAMAGQVSREAAALDSLVKPPQVAPSDSLRRPLAMAAICSLGMLVFLAVDWRHHARLLHRFVAPTGSHTLSDISRLSGDAVVARGGPWSLSAAASGWTPATGALWIQGPDGDTKRVRLAVSAEQEIDHKIDSVTSSFRYRLRVGDALSEWHDVTVVDAPKLIDVAFSIRPPSYTRQSAYERDEIPRSVKARAGSRLDLALRVDLPETAAELEIIPRSESSPPRTIALSGGTDGWKRFQTILLEDMSFHVVLRNNWGLTNDDPPRCRITVIPDRPPLARVLSGSDEVAVRPDDVIDIQFEALDDIGIAKAELIVYDDSTLDDDGEPAVLAVQEIDLGEQALARRVVVDTQLDLSQFDVADGDSISYAIRVSDSRLADFESGQEQSPPMARADDSPGSTDQPQAARGSAAESSQEPSASPEGELARSSAGEPPTQGSARRGDAQPMEGMDSSMPRARLPGETLVASDSSRTMDGVDPGPGPVVTGPSPPVAARQDRDNSDLQEQMRQFAANLQELPVDLAEARSESRRQRLVVDARLRAFGNRNFALLREKISRKFDQLAMPLTEGEFELAKVRDELGEAKRLSAKHLGRLRAVDVDLEDSELLIGEMHRLTSGTPYYFVGKGVVEIGVADVSPARDSLVASLQARGSARPEEVKSVSERVSAARESLSALRERFDAVAREHELAESIERVRKLFGDYVANAMKLMRDARSLDPQKYRTDIARYDEEYRKRLAEVLKLRREMLAELSRMLANDPRLLRRFLALGERRRSSLREELMRLMRWQAELAAELQAWSQYANGSQLREVWTVVTERRLSSVAQLNQAIEMVVRRINTQLPLEVKLEDAAAGRLLAAAKQASDSGEAMLASVRSSGDDSGLTAHQAAEQAHRDLEELNAYVAAFAEEHGEPAAGFAANRTNEIDGLLAGTADWVEQTELFERREYHALAAPDQSRLALQTEQLAEEVSAAVQDLAGSFEDGIPEDVAAAGDQLAATFEPLVLNQLAAAFAFEGADLTAAGRQQQQALEGFKLTQIAFDQLWKLLRKYESEREFDLPELQDPTLDELLRFLEEEPDLRRLLGMRLGPLGFGFLVGWSGWADGYYARDWWSGYQSAMKRAEEAGLFTGPEMSRNPLASQLDERMWQVQSQLPPEQFRESIEQYFDQLRRLAAPETESE